MDGASTDGAATDGGATAAGTMVKALNTRIDIRPPRVITANPTGANAGACSMRRCTLLDPLELNV
jgi:hypothetical protein